MLVFGVALLLTRIRAFVGELNQFQRECSISFTLC